MMINPVYRRAYNYRRNTWFTLVESAQVWHDQTKAPRVVNEQLYLDNEPVDPRAFVTIDDDYWKEIVEAYITLYGMPLDFYDETTDKVDDDILKALRRLTIRYGEHYASSVWSNEEDDSTKMRQAFNASLPILMNQAELAYRRYKPILKAYKEREDELLAQIQNKTSADSRFNDTPQNGGDWSDDAHTTNITQMSSTSSTDGDTPIRRLEEVRRLWVSVFDQMVEHISSWLLEGSNL